MNFPKVLYALGLASVLSVASVAKAEENEQEHVSLPNDLDSVVEETDMPAEAEAGVSGSPDKESDESSYLDVSADFTVAGRYRGSGFEFSRGPTIQPSLSATSHGLTGLVWFNFDIADRAVNETDLIFQYSRPVGPFNLTGGYALYLIPEDTSQEVFASIGVSSLLEPTVSVRYNWDLPGGGQVFTGQFQWATK